MGTRHNQKVITKKGELKIDQYGQWDGYPSGQGLDILKFLRKGDLDKYQKNLEKIPQITDEQIKETNKDKNWETNYPYLSRDCGSDIHQMVEDGTVQFVFHCGAEGHRWCAGFYTIDFSKNIFTSYFDGIEKSFPLDNLPTEEEYLKIMEPEDEE